MTKKDHSTERAPTGDRWSAEDGAGSAPRSSWWRALQSYKRWYHHPNISSKAPESHWMCHIVKFQVPTSCPGSAPVGCATHESSLEQRSKNRRPPSERAAEWLRHGVFSAPASRISPIVRCCGPTPTLSVFDFQHHTVPARFVQRCAPMAALVRDDVAQAKHALVNSSYQYLEYFL